MNKKSKQSVLDSLTKLAKGLAQSVQQSSNKSNGSKSTNKKPCGGCSGK